MEYKKVEITDDYINEMAEYFERQGKSLQSMVDAYIALMRRVIGEGISEGETAEALGDFLAYAERLQQIILEKSRVIRDCTMNYLEEVDSQDYYLY